MIIFDLAKLTLIGSLEFKVTPETYYEEIRGDFYDFYMACSFLSMPAHLLRSHNEIG